MSAEDGNDDRTRMSPTDDDRTVIGPSDESSSDGSTVAPSARAAQSRPRVLGPYTLVRLLGRGGMGAVWEAVDFRLDRRVALKISTADPSPDAIERFRREATHSARLRHPHIVSVHDVGFDQGQQYLVMDLVQGSTLAEALRSGRLTYRRKAEILERVARAVHYAHEQGVVHRDLKPSNIMLESRRPVPGSGASSIGTSAFRATADDDFGEPLVMDFGLAKDVGNDSSLSRSGFAIGTPSYMPPEQAEGRLDAVGPRSDVWSLGAILYEMLTGRPPFTGESTMRVLKAVLGEEPVPPRRISRDVPRDLETICLACLQKDPARRYASAEALANDLRAWLAGESISARPATALERAFKLLKRHRVAALVLVLVMPTLVTLALLYGEHLKERADWQTLASEEFAGDDWKSRWSVLCGEFVRRDDGRIASARWGSNIIACSRKLLGPVAIEYEAEMLQGSPPCDISLIWARGLKAPSPRTEVNAPYNNLFDRPIELKIGAFDGSYSAIMINGQHVAYDPFKPEHGVRYRVRVEVVDNHVSIGVDGRTLCTYTDPFPLTGGYACLFGFYPGKAFGHVRIQTLSVPQKVPATAIGDAFAQDGAWAKAAEQYARVAIAHPGTAIAREAVYKQGLCEFRSGDHDAAFATWHPLEGGEYDELLALHRLDVLAEADDFERFLTGLEALFGRATPATRVRVAVRWAEFVHHQVHDDRERSARLLAVHDRVFPEQTTVDNTAAECLFYLGRYQELIDRYPHQRRMCAMALVELGKLDVVARDYSDQRSTCGLARFRAGMFDQLAELGPEGENWLPQVLLEQGRLEEVQARYPASMNAVCALLMLGRLDEAAAKPRNLWTEYADLFAGRYDRLTMPKARLMAAMVQRKFDQVDCTNNGDPYDPYLVFWARQCAGIQAATRGDIAAAAKALTPTPELSTVYETEYAIDELLFVPLARELCGADAGSFDRACDGVVADLRYAWTQCPWHAAAYLRGRINEQEFLAQPRRRFAEANLGLLAGIREERAGHRETALERYRSYLAMKPWQRGEEPLPLRELFAEWRIAALGSQH
jgi:serine/threonine protein kinase